MIDENTKTPLTPRRAISASPTCKPTPTTVSALHEQVASLKAKLANLEYASRIKDSKLRHATAQLAKAEAACPVKADVQAISQPASAELSDADLQIAAMKSRLLEQVQVIAEQQRRLEMLEETVLSLQTSLTRKEKEVQEKTDEVENLAKVVLGHAASIDRKDGLLVEQAGRIGHLEIALQEVGRERAELGWRLGGISRAVAVVLATGKVRSEVNPELRYLCEMALPELEGLREFYRFTAEHGRSLEVVLPRCEVDEGTLARIRWGNEEIVRRAEGGYNAVGGAVGYCGSVVSSQFVVVK